MTLKEMIDRVLLLSGIGTETAYAGSSNPALSRLVALANQSITALARHHWTALRRIHTFTLSTDTQYELPDDFLSFVPDTMYSDTHAEGMDFPASTEEWSYLKANSGGSDNEKVRLIAGKLNVHEPDSGSVVRFEYNSKYPVVASDGSTFKALFTADTDTTLLDDELLISDLLWRYKKLMGLQDWQVDFAESQRLYQTLKGQDGSAKTIGPRDGVSGTPYYDLWRPVPNS